MITSEPDERLVVVNVATPDEFRLAVPSKVLPLKKLIVPTGVPVGLGVTVAVSVTVCPVITGFGAAVSTVLVAVSAAPVSGTLSDWLAARLASPGYMAPTLWVPAPSTEIPVAVALPDDAHFVTRNFIVNIQQLKFAEAGLYSVDVRLDDKSQGSIPLLIKHLPPGGTGVTVPAGADSGTARKR